MSWTCLLEYMFWTLLILLVVLAVHIYPSVPYDLADRNKKRILLAALNLTNFVVSN